MPSLNKVMIIGNITREIELKYTPTGKAVTDIGIAMNHTWTNDKGEKKEDVVFADVTLWGRTAEVVAEYCKKGQPIFVEGKLALDSWTDKESGQKRSKLKVVGENIQLLGGGDRGEVKAPKGPAQATEDDIPMGGNNDDTVPF